MKKTPFIGFYGYWVILTYLSIFSAVTGMYFAINGNVTYAIFCLMICGVCDMFDGPVARLKKRTNREETFGILIDSLADIISFGVFPAVVGHAIFSSNPPQYDGRLGTIISIAVLSAYVLTALIRLAYFNVIEIELHGKNEKRKYYEGLPVTNVALIIPVVYAVCIRFSFPLAPVYSAVLAILSIAFVVRIRIPKLRLRYMIGFCLIGLIIAVFVF